MNRARWRVITVDPPHSLEIEDGFADESGRPAAGQNTLPTHGQLVTERAGSGRPTPCQGAAQVSRSTTETKRTSFRYLAVKVG